MTDPPVTVEVPGKGIIEFPAGTPRETIEQALRQFAAPPVERNETLNTLRITGTGALQGAARMGDEAKKLLGPPPGGMLFRPGEQWQGAGGTKPIQALGLPTDPEAEAKRLGAEMTPLRKSLASGARVGTEVALMGAKPLVSAIAGVGAGAGRAIGEQAGAPETGEIIGSLALPAIGLGAARALAPKTAAPLSADALKDTARSLYKTGDDAGVILSGQFWDRAIRVLEKRLANQGYHPAAHPQTATGIKILQDSVGQNVTWKGVDTLRDTVRDLAAAAKTDKDRRLVKMMTDTLNTYLRRAPSGAVLQGDLPLARESYRQADVLWSRAKKADKIAELIRRAELSAPNFSASGYENAIRTEFRNFAKNAKEMRKLAPQERAAVEAIAKGGPVQNILRALGRSAPIGGLMQTLHVGAAAASGGLSVPLSLATGASRYGARAMQKQNAKTISEMMRRGGPALTRSMTPAEKAAIRALIYGPAATIAD